MTLNQLLVERKSFISRRSKPATGDSIMSLNDLHRSRTLQSAQGNSSQANTGK